MAGRSWLYLLLAALLAALVWQRGQTSSRARDHRTALNTILQRRGLRLVPDEAVIWLARPRFWGNVDAAFFLAHEASSRPADLYYAEMHRRRRGSVLGLAWLSNLTRTPSAAETALLRQGMTLLHSARLGRHFDSITLLDMRCEPRALTDGWPRVARAQHAITNLASTGRLRGIGRRRYTFRKPISHLRIAARDQGFVVDADGIEIRLDASSWRAPAGIHPLDLRPFQPAQPSTITWVVDTVRNVPWIGPAPIEWLEHRVFAAKDRWERLRHKLQRRHPDDGAVDEISSSQTYASAANWPAAAPTAFAPPDDLQPLLPHPVRGEGHWLPFQDPAFVRSYPSAPPPFHQTFLRCDADRAFTQVFITRWDPRQLQLAIMAGTAEPASATGETGAGMVPRDPEVLRWLVAGFNGGFQALHGEFGMQTEGRVYLPPKPWAATVAVFADGRVGLGSWPPPAAGTQVYDPTAALEQIPTDMVAFRQNLTSVVENGTYNPWQRWWWGAAPQEAGEQTYIDRSGLCLTTDGHMAYFWGQSLGPEALGQAMLSCGCVRGMHLDMNLRHTGFEFYRLHPPQQTPAPLDRPLQDFEWQGPVPSMPQWSARARKAVKSMQPMHFPRYLGRDRRDFFYLTLRPTLPGPPLQEAASMKIAPTQAAFRPIGPQAQWPAAFAVASIGAGPARSSILRLDPHRAKPQALATTDCVGQSCGRQTTLAYLTTPSDATAPSSGPLALYAQRQLTGWRLAIGEPPSDSTVLLRGRPVTENPAAVAALGIDVDGFLVYFARGQDHAMAQLLTPARVQQALALERGVQLMLAQGSGWMAIDGTVVHDGLQSSSKPISLAFVAGAKQASEILFPDTTPQPYRIWARLQDSRIRYFRQEPPTFRR